MKTRNNYGFSVVEAIVIFVIIAIVGVLGYVAYDRFIGSSNNTINESNNGTTNIVAEKVYSPKDIPVATEISNQDDLNSAIEAIDSVDIEGNDNQFTALDTELNKF